MEVFLMAYVISDSCISCGACAAGCPCAAISEGAEHYEIDVGIFYKYHRYYTELVAECQQGAAGAAPCFCGFQPS